MVTDVSTVEGRAATRRRRALKAAASAYAVIRSDGPVGQIIRFTWHFVQMAVVMMLGMAPLGLILSALGQSDLGTRSPEAKALAMTASSAEDDDHGLDATQPSSPPTSWSP